MSERPIFTYQTRIRASTEVDAALAGYAAVYGQAQRKLFARIAAGDNAAKIKSEFSQASGLSARQFNALRIELEGKIDAIRERRKGLIEEAQQRIKKLAGRIKKLGIDPDLKTNRVNAKRKSGVKPAPKLEFPHQRKKRLFELHQKKRRLATLQARLARMQADENADVTRLCFGGKKRFHSQFDLNTAETKNHKDHAAWKLAWDAARNAQFFVLGSKDELSGCQGCQASIEKDESLTLRLRLPDEIAKNIGKHLVISGLRFAYGQKEIVAALSSSQRIASRTTAGKTIGKDIVKRTGTALSYRFVRDAKSWTVFVSVEAPAVSLTTSRLLGALGVDINADHLAVSEIDRFGNLVHAAKIQTITYGKSTDQAKAVLGDAAVLIARRAKEQGKPVVLELLDFQKKKAELQGSSWADRRQARMLSSFACSKAVSSIKAACFREGVEVILVNPAYTSVIGAVNHARTKGISTHQGAAFAIARRGLGLSERPTVRAGSIVLTPVRNGGHVTFELPARNRSKHVWSFWSGARTRLKAAHAAHIRCDGHKRPAPPLTHQDALDAKIVAQTFGQAVCATTGFITVRARDASGPNCADHGPLGDLPF